MEAVNKVKNALIFVFFFINIFFLTKDCYSITFYYETEALSGTQATVYYDYGSGYTEEYSAYCDIEGNKVTFPLKNSGNIQNINIVPIRVIGEDNIISAKVSFMGLTVTTLDTGTVHVMRDNENAWPSFEYNKNFLFNETSFVRVYAIAVLVLMCYILISFSLFGIRHLYCRDKKDKISYTFRWRENIYCFLEIAFLPAYTSTLINVYMESRAFVILLLVFIMITLLNASVLSIFKMNADEEEKVITIGKLGVYHRTDWNEVNGLYLKAVIVYVAYYIMQNYLKDGVCSVSAAIRRLSTIQAPFNLLWMFLALLLIYLLLGNGLANAMFLVFTLILFIGNIIKITYHHTLLTPMDFSMIPDMLRIADSVLSKSQLLLIVSAICVILLLIIVFRKKVLAYLKPYTRLIQAGVCLVIIVPYTYLLLSQHYVKEYNIGYNFWLAEYDKESSNGVYLYNMFNVANAGKSAMEKPKKYDEFYMAAIEQDIVDTCDAGIVSDVKPNVICIMAESLFDIESVEGISFNEEIFPTVRKYQKSTLISPCFGGKTAAVEYEALTGHSLYFYKEGTMPYTTFFKSDVNSVATEFDNNGYYTIAFHPNTGKFYNRENAYSLMGFKEINTIENITLTKEDMIDSGEYCNDEAFAKNVIRMMEEQEEPVFLFGVSIAGHYIDGDHDSDTTIKVEDTFDFTDDEKHVLEQTADAYQESDEMIRMLIEYVDSCEEPTILYVFGDHLPPLPIWPEMDYTEDIYNKYSTILLGYSNYKEIEFPEYITPNYLGAQILYDAEVEHTVYWDYLYNMRNELPVFQKEFVEKNDKNTDLIDKYEAIQYDLMFGKKYLLNKE